MSRVGNAIIEIPSGVTVEFANQVFKAKGKLGELSMPVPSYLSLENDGKSLKVVPAHKSRVAVMMWGTTRRNIANIVKGVSDGFTLNIEIVGVGYRAAVQGNKLVLQLGFSHDVNYPIPTGITVKCEKPTTIQLHGANKQQVGQMAAEIRSFRPPEPYKGKGVIREGDYVVRKEGKKK
jgi:large subunit ribosomal protein L6